MKTPTETQELKIDIEGVKETRRSVSSPDTRKRRIFHQWEQEEKEYNDTWRSCCSRSGYTDRRLIQYITRFSLSVLTLVFSCIQLIRAHDCDPLVPFYSSLITFVLGAWLQSDDKKINNPK